MAEMVLKKLSGHLKVVLTPDTNTKLIFSVLLAKDDFELDNFMSFTYDENSVNHDED